MIRIITSAAVALMLGGAAFVAPASAANVVVKMGNGHGMGNGHHGGHVQHCSVQKIVTHKHGKTMVRTVRTCH